MAGQVDAAIGAVEQPRPITMATVTVTLPTGRPVRLILPVDLTAQETVSLMGFIGTGLGAELAKGRTPGPRLLVPRRG